MLKYIADKINILGDFCGKRDIPELTTEQLLKKYGLSQADVMVLLAEVLCAAEMFWHRQCSSILQRNM